MPSPSAPTAKARMLVGRPAADLFAAFTDPDILTRFWLARAGGPLELGKAVRWDFMVEGASVMTTATALDAGKRIAVAWSDGTNVEWTFTEQESMTVVTIEHSGFSGPPDEAVEAAIEATQGFTIVLCDLKTLLETGASTNLVRDKARLIEREAADKG